MSVAFPLGPPPAYYTLLTPSQAHGVYYVGDTPSFTLNKSGATGYSVRDYWGAVVSSGSVSGTTVTPAAPSGGWKPGWYRLYLTGGSTDALFGPAYGATCFAVIRADSRFPTVTSTTGSGGESRDVAFKAMLGMGTSRLTIGDVDNPTTGLDTVAVASSDVTLSNAYWTVAPGSPYYDSARARVLWATFPNGTSNPAHVTSVVSSLYALGITRFEGPSNEPTLNASLVTAMQNFHDAVKAANASAVVLGPTPVQLDAAPSGGLEQFLAAGGGNYIDEWAVHAYNSQTNGDINLARVQWAAFKAMLAKYGQGSKPIWQTESCHVFTSVYGVYHPRRARVPLLMTLFGEQQGIPRERQAYWYDRSHGFWSYPAWWQHGDGTLNPQAVLYRVLAEETFGQTHASALDFGTIGNRIFLGSIYSGAAGKTAVLVAQSYLPGASVTLAVTGTSGPLTAVDGFGNASSLTLSSGQIVVPVSDVPTYLRLPSGASVSVVTCNDWPANRSGWLSNATAGGVSVGGAVTSPQYVNDDAFLFQYSGGSSDGISRGSTMPDTLSLTWPTATRLDRLIIWTGCWQSTSALVDFDVQTSNDGTTWTTQATVTKATPSSFVHGSDSNGVGCQRETYWDEQWIFDVKLPAPVTAKMVRLNVRATSYGGEPDAASNTAGGQGNAGQFITVQEIAVLCDDNTVPRYGGEAR